MSYFEFQNAVKLLCGELALERIPNELQHLNAKRPLVLSDAVLAKIGTMAQVTSAMEAEGVTPAACFTDIPVDSSLAVVNKIAAFYREQDCDSIVAIGGGSVIDTAKGVRLVLSQDTDDIFSISGLENVTNGRHIPFVVVPTTAGTGSECTGVAVIKNDENGVKMEFLSPFVEPDVAVIDPRMTEGLPPKATASTGMDALCHAVEACTCLQANPLSTAYGTAAIRLIAQNLETATVNGKNREARFNMALASTMAGIAFSNSMVGAVHAIGHALGGVCGVPHAVAMTILLPHVMRYNLSHSAGDYAALLPWLVGMDAAMATPADKRAEAAIEAIEALGTKLNAACGLPLTLSAAGVSKDSFAKVAEFAVNDGALIVNPRAATVEQVVEILNAAF
ncbi:MAG: iron-containing alcohol dehydrogenase [Akkermansia sp.]|nr:iron-containing alcohol dehydrogenase [Akkermansiaceae bacterium]MBQ4636666.1 iron-containing alcohol dehydrogenase [Akkermansia sp.]